MTTLDDKAAAIERQSLELGKWGNLLMGIAGVSAAYFSRSDALLVDGLYSGVNFVSAIVAARVSAAVRRPADRRYPFGYAAYEALYVKFRAMVLLGIMTFAVFGAARKIATYATGGKVPELVFGPILIYAVVMVLTCAALAAWHYYNWQRSGRQSELLTTESKAAVVDGIISSGAGGGLLAASLLRGTLLEPIVPIADSIVVLLMTVLIIRQPVLMFLSSLKEVAGGAASPVMIEQLKARLENAPPARPFEMIELAVTKLGRTHFVVAYLKPESPVSGAEADEIRAAIESSCNEALGEAKAEVIVTASFPYP